MSQNYNKLETDTTSVKKFVQSEYLYWLDKAMSKHVKEPVHASNVSSQNPNAELFLGYFESLFSYFLIYEKFLKKDNMFIWNPATVETKEDEEGDTLRRTQDMLEYENDGGVLLTQAGTVDRAGQSKDTRSKDTALPVKSSSTDKNPGPGFKKLTSKVNSQVNIKELEDLALDVNEEDYNNRHKGLLDLVKVRAKNKSFFDEDSVSAAPSKARGGRDMTVDTVRESSGEGRAV